MKKISALILSATLLGACATSEAPPQPIADSKPATLQEFQAERWLGVITWMFEGTSETIVQEPGYAAGGGDNTPVRLRVLRLWPERQDQYWFYFEYVDPKNEAKAFRQRISRLVREGDRVTMIDYAFPSDARNFLGEWRKPHPFESVDPARLKPLPGCRAFWLVQHDAVVSGGTETDTCQGDGPPGTHEHVDYWLGSSFLRTWAQQLDASGKQVGGLPGPSEYRKLTSKMQ